MLDFLFGNPGKSRRVRRWHTFIVEKPICAPARPIVYTLEKYGIPISGYSEKFKDASTSEFLTQAGVNSALLKAIGDRRTVPIAQLARFKVPAQQANWAEYLLWRTEKLAVVQGQVDGRNADWARRHGGAMPPQNNMPWIERDCAEGKKIWGKKTG